MDCKLGDPTAIADRFREDAGHYAPSDRLTYAYSPTTKTESLLLPHLTGPDALVILQLGCDEIKGMSDDELVATVSAHQCRFLENR